MNTLRTSLKKPTKVLCALISVAALLVGFAPGTAIYFSQLVFKECLFGGKVWVFKAGFFIREKLGRKKGGGGRGP